MTIRTIPAAPQIERPENVRFEIAPEILDRWHPDIRAAAAPSDNNVISILDFIGDDGEGGGFSSARMAGALRAIGNKAVEVQINSPGGNFFEGLSMYNMLRDHPKDVTVKVLGLAGSAASVIAMAGDTIMAPRAGFFMIHNTSGVTMGDQAAHRKMLATLEKFDAVSADLYAARTRLSPKAVTQMMNAGTWLSGKDAVDHGFADSLLPADQITNAVREEATLTPAQVAARRIDAALASAERIPRSERRKLMKEITAGTPRAVTDGTPSAADTVEDDGLSDVRLALARLKLARA